MRANVDLSLRERKAVSVSGDMILRAPPASRGATGVRCGTRVGETSPLWRAPLESQLGTL